MPRQRQGLGPADGPPTVGFVRRLLWYSRASWERHLGVEGDDLEIREWARDNGYELAEEAFFDNSAGGLRRPEDLPELSRALALIESGEAQALVVKRQDRLCCDPGYLKEILVRVWAAGGEVFSVEEGRFENDPKKILQYQKLAAFHAVMRIDSQMRRLDGKRARLATGAFNGGTPFGGRPYGYRLLEGQPIRKVPVPAEQAVIRECIAACPGGRGYAAQARVLNERGEPTVTGAPWSAKTVRHLVLSAEARPRALVTVSLHPGNGVQEAGSPRTSRRESA